MSIGTADDATERGWLRVPSTETVSSVAGVSEDPACWANAGGTVTQTVAKTATPIALLRGVLRVEQSDRGLVRWLEGMD